MTEEDRTLKSFFHRKFGVMGNKADNSCQEYGRRILKMVFGFVQYVFQIFFGLVYRGNKECMPPIKDLLLLESASTIAMKIRSGKVSLSFLSVKNSTELINTIDIDITELILISCPMSHNLTLKFVLNLIKARYAFSKAYYY